jgi:hypothetical protein
MTERSDSVSKTKHDSNRYPIFGGNSEGATPVPIPNTAVNPFCADGTAFFGRGRVGRCRILLDQARHLSKCRAFSRLASLRSRLPEARSSEARLVGLLG